MLLAPFIDQLLEGWWPPDRRLSAFLDSALQVALQIPCILVFDSDRLLEAILEEREGKRLVVEAEWEGPGGAVARGGGSG